jgi:hypothetical protein
LIDMTADTFERFRTHDSKPATFRKCDPAPGGGSSWRRSPSGSRAAEIDQTFPAHRQRTIRFGSVPVNQLKYQTLDWRWPASGPTLGFDGLIRGNGKSPRAKTIASARSNGGGERSDG